jgi:hypothetical protein
MAGLWIRHPQAARFHIVEPDNGIDDGYDDHGFEGEQHFPNSPGMQIYRDGRIHIHDAQGGYQELDQYNRYYHHQPDQPNRHPLGQYNGYPQYHHSASSTGNGKWPTPANMG